MWISRDPDGHPSNPEHKGLLGCELCKNSPADVVFHVGSDNRAVGICSECVDWIAPRAYADVVFGQSFDSGCDPALPEIKEKLAEFQVAFWQSLYCTSAATHRALIRNAASSTAEPD